jgi:hypothetical protein
MRAIDGRGNLDSIHVYDAGPDVPDRYSIRLASWPAQHTAVRLSVASVGDASPTWTSVRSGPSLGVRVPFHSLPEPVAVLIAQRFAADADS